MGIPGSANPMLLGGAQAYQIEQSLRFDGSSYLSRSIASTGSTSQSVSFWMKLGEPTGTKAIISRAIVSGSSYKSVQLNNSALEVRNGYTGVATTSPGLQRDPSAWYHVVVSIETSVGSKIYVNGELFGSSNDTYHFLVSGQPLSIGRFTGLTQSPFNGYLAEMYFSDGSVLDPDDFGEYNDSGVWVPKEATGITYGTHGFYLKFDPSATNGIGHDHSGNGNNFTATGFTTSGTGTDVMSDTPTTNWCTLNPLVRPGNTAISDGNLTYSTSIAEHALSTFGVTEGKWYCEVTLGGANCFLGLVNSTQYRISYIGSTTLFAVADNNSEYSPNSTRSFSSLSSFTTSDVIGFALDATNKTCDVYKNNSKVLTYDTFTLDGPYFFSFDRNASSPSVTHTVNFGQRAFAYTPPTGYKALNTAYLPAPDIADGSEYFNTVLWTGTSAENPISTVGFQPDLTWIKGRDNSTNHVLVDAVRGATKVLESDSTAAEYTDAQSVKSFDTNGFTLGTSNDVNNSAAGYNQYVAWNWLASNTSGSSNTAGSITSTVSANPSAGFSIVSYTGTLSGTPGTMPTVGHGLGVAPQLVISKSRNNGGIESGNWFVWHASAGTGNWLRLNTTAAAASISASGGGTMVAPTDTVFSTPYISGSNISGATYVAYCFTEVGGYSKFGSYTGNGSADGPFVYCGFRPTWVMIKRTDSAANWQIYDVFRDPYNRMFRDLVPNSSAEENSISLNIGVAIDALSNGFKLRDSDTAGNASSSTYIFIAFAENPFGGSGVSPATAR